MSGGGGGGPTSSTVTQSNVPDWLRPQVETLISGATKELFTTQPGEGDKIDITKVKPYTPYSQNAADYVAGFSPLQQQAFGGAANLQMPGQFGAASFGTQQASLGAAGAGNQYMNMATNPFATQAFMSPYMQNVVDVQQQQAQRQSDIANQAMNAGFAQRGAFGGGRQGIAQAMANADLMRQKQGIQATGLQNAFQQAQQAQQFGANLGLQGLSTALGGFGQLGNLGTQQLAAQRGILDTQNQMGAIQQQREQNIINQAVQNFAQARENPITRLNQFNALLRGYAQPGQTSTTYQAAPPMASQLAGLGTAAYGASKLFSAAKGGAVKEEPQRMATGGIPEINRKVLFDPNSVSLPQIQQGIKNETVSDLIGVPVALQKQKMAQAPSMQVPAEQPNLMQQAMSPGIAGLPSNLPTQMATGGIVAFNGEDEEGSVVSATAPNMGSKTGRHRSLSEALQEYRLALGTDSQQSPELQAYLKAQQAAALKPEDIQQQKGMRILQAGLGMLGGRSPNALENISAGAMPALAGYAEDVKGQKAAGLASLKAQADAAEAARAERRGEVKSAAESLEKERDRLTRIDTARAPHISLISAQNYLKMRKEAGDPRPNEEILDEGLRIWSERQGAALQRVQATLAGVGAGLQTAGGAQSLTAAGQEQAGARAALEAWGNLKFADPDARQYRKLLKKDREEAEKFKQDWIKANTPKPITPPSPVAPPAKPAAPAAPAAAPAAKTATKPDIGTITGAPAGSSIGGFVQGKGWEVKDKSGKLLGYAQ